MKIAAARTAFGYRPGNPPKSIAEKSGGGYPNGYASVFVPTRAVLYADFPAKPVPRFGWQSVSSIVELSNGNLLAAWFAGKYEISPDSAIYYSRFKRSTGEWSAPAVLSDEHGVPEGNPVLVAYKNEVWCIYEEVHGNAFEFGRLYRRILLDQGHTWSAKHEFTHPPYRYPTGTLAACRPEVLSNGEILVPLNRESYDPDPGKQWYSLFMKSADGGRTWHDTKPLYSFPGNIQPTMVELSPGNLLSYFRPRGLGHTLWQSSSHNYGKTWSPLQQSRIPNPSARTSLLRLKSGRLILAFNDSSTRRTPLVLAMSEQLSWCETTAVQISWLT